MKKIFLSAAVILSFGLYAFSLRPHGRDDGQVIAPTNNVTEPVTTPTDSGQTASSNLPPPTATTPIGSQKYKNGSFTGSVEDAFYGNVQVKVVISGGKITDVQFLQYPNDRQNSVYINSQAMPYLKSEAIQAQSAAVDIVSGATATSLAFQKSLATALQGAKA